MNKTIVLDPAHASYPSALGVLGTAKKLPPTLYLRGTLPKSLPIAIVGCRGASREAIAFTRSLVHGLADADISIWSGGAIGIDGAAHKAALEVGIPTVVIMGSGLDCPYPPEHLRLYEQILEAGGALLSHLPDAYPPRRYTFLARNEVLAAIAAATIVIEAGFQSGARSTAGFARRLEKPLGVVPHAPWNERGAGCALELANGAQAITSPADILRLVGLKEAISRKTKSRATTSEQLLLTDHEISLPNKRARMEQVQMGKLGDLEQSIWKIMNDEPQHVEVICEKVNAAYPAVVGALLTLTLELLVEEEPAGCYRRR